MVLRHSSDINYKTKCEQQKKTLKINVNCNTKIYQSL